MKKSVKNRNKIVYLYRNNNKIKKIKMDKEFNNLSAEYQQARKKNDVNKQKELIAEMQKRLVQRNGGSEEYTNSLMQTKYSIFSTVYQELLEINGDMNMIESQKKLDDLSENERKKETEQNKYSADNPYPRSHINEP